MLKKDEKNFFLIFLIISFLVLLGIGGTHIITSNYINKIVFENHRYSTEKLIKTVETGVYYYLSEIQRDLEKLSKNKSIENFDERGKILLSDFQKTNFYIYSAVSRVDAKGKIEYTFPYDKSAIGRDVLYQEHNKKLFKNKVSVISRPFLAVQGYKAIAIAIPVISNGKFRGGLTGLIPFDILWELYFSNIKPTQNSFVVVANSDGGIIYSPEIFHDFDNVSQMIEVFRFEDTLRLDKQDDYSMERVTVLGDKDGNLIGDRYTLIKSSIDIDGNIIYILTFSPEADIKLVYQTIFRTQTLFAYMIIFLMVLTGIVFIKYLSTLIESKDRLVKEISSEKNMSEDERLFLENIIKSIIKVNGLYLFVIDKGGEILYHNQIGISEKNFYDFISSENIVRIKNGFEFVYEKERITMMIFEIKLNKKYINILFNISSFANKSERFLVLFGFEYGKIKDMTLMPDIFVDTFKRWYVNDKGLFFLDRDGKILVSNRKCNDAFKDAKNISDILKNIEQAEFQDILEKLYSGIDEITVEFENEGLRYKALMSPVMNEFLKAEYISVEII